MLTLPLMGIKHKLLARDTVSREGALTFNTTFPLLFFSLYWPTKLGCLSWSNFSHRTRLLTHIGLRFYLLAAAVVAPTWKLVLAFNSPGFLLMYSQRLFWSTAHFLSKPTGLDCCCLNKPCVCWIVDAVKTVPSWSLRPMGVFKSVVFPHLQNEGKLLLHFCWLKAYNASYLSFKL